VPKVLLVEDNKLNRMASERSLAKAGYRVVSAHDGEQALEMAERELPDVILLDMMLPKLSGPEVLKQLKRNPVTARIPVIVLTGLSQKNEARLREEGATAFAEKSAVLDKPEFLLNLIRESLRKVGAPTERSALLENTSVPSTLRPIQ
jgi:CheY-like chemotaxis protein